MSNKTISYQTKTKLLTVTTDSNIINTIMLEINNYKDLTLNNLVFLVTNLMITIGQYVSLTGVEKKELIIIILNKHIDTLIIDENIKQTLKLAVDSLVPTMIDVMVDISKGKYNFKIKYVCSTIFSCCR